MRKRYTDVDVTLTERLEDIEKITAEVIKVEKESAVGRNE